MDQKILDQVMRRMEAQACSAPSKSLSPTRMQVRSGQRCIGCMGLLPPPHTPGIQYCTLCRPAPDGTRCTCLLHIDALTDGIANSSSGT